MRRPISHNTKFSLAAQQRTLTPSGCAVLSELAKIISQRLRDTSAGIKALKNEHDKLEAKQQRQMAEDRLQEMFGQILRVC